MLWQELKTLKFVVRNTSLGIEIELRTDKRKIETDYQQLKMESLSSSE